MTRAAQNLTDAIGSSGKLRNTDQGLLQFLRLDQIGINGGLQCAQFVQSIADHVIAVLQFALHR